MELWAFCPSFRRWGARQRTRPTKRHNINIGPRLARGAGGRGAGGNKSDLNTDTEGSFNLSCCICVVLPQGFKLCREPSRAESTYF
ncbi:hypothetical protein EVAR_41752_1 [Eumeta japonica]|uniref:Uncharacterized protein n=1 Tax=Eumeta variegata TaxID=151549 RepID=A0A4C1VX96_EUMVA|nr:hypothetical protein EVAR_41752_1 [Eumeta japonica]